MFKFNIKVLLHSMLAISYHYLFREELLGSVENTGEESNKVATWTTTFGSSAPRVPRQLRVGSYD